MQSRGIKGLHSSLRINYADYVGFPPELLALVNDYIERLKRRRFWCALIINQYKASFWL